MVDDPVGEPGQGHEGGGETVGLVVNIVMLLTNTTQTVNVDIWNYWHFAFTGALMPTIRARKPLFLHRGRMSTNM